MDLFNTSTPEKAYKTSVQPLGILLILQSLCLIYAFLTWPASSLMKAPLPFVPDPVKKVFLITTAVTILIIGIGLLLRSKLLWYLFVGYLIIVPFWIILGVLFDYFPKNGPPKQVLIPLLCLFSTLISGGVILVTKPAFKKELPHKTPKSSG